jgi:hypothetical protein
MGIASFNQLLVKTGSITGAAVDGYKGEQRPLLFLKNSKESLQTIDMQHIKYYIKNIEALHVCGMARISG